MPSPAFYFSRRREIRKEPELTPEMVNTPNALQETRGDVIPLPFPQSLLPHRPARAQRVVFFHPEPDKTFGMESFVNDGFRTTEPHTKTPRGHMTLDPVRRNIAQPASTAFGNMSAGIDDHPYLDDSDGVL